MGWGIDYGWKMEAIVLAGGKGSRLAGYLAGKPKPMADIGGRPFLEYLLDVLKSEGIQRVVLSVGYCADVIVAHFQNAYDGLAICYAKEDMPLGTGGAIKNAMRFCADSDVFVVNGDTLLQLDYRAMMAEHQARKAGMSIAVREVADVSRYGAIVTDQAGVLEQFGEKRAAGQGLINSGTYLLKRNIFEGFSLPETFSMETDLIATHLKEIAPIAFRTDGYFIDIGIPADLERARLELPVR